MIDDPRQPGVQPICRAALSGLDTNCVPWDIFATGQVTPGALHLSPGSGLPARHHGESVVSAVLTGALGGYGVTAPWATEGVASRSASNIARESLDFSADATFQTGDLAGQGAPTLPVSGAFDVKELFAEVRIPLVQDNFLHSASLTGGYRYSSYENSAGSSFSTDTYKIEGEISPIADIRVRGGYNRAVRAPTVQDLFSPQFVGLDGTGDPCAGAAITAADRGCLAQGLTVGQIIAPNPASQYNGLFGGNPSLLPEVADTWSVGVVLQPSFIPRLAVSVDWYKIDLAGAVGGIGADTILTVCDNTADPFFCGLVHRDASGSLWRTSDGYVNDTTQNIGGISTQGIDINGSYSIDVSGIGQLSASYVGTLLDELVVDTGISGTYDCAGLYGNICSTPEPQVSPTLARVGWELRPSVGASIRWRYFGGVAVDTTSSNTNLTGVWAPLNEKIAAQNYFDLTLTARVAEHYSFRLGVNNIFDRSPPLTGSGGRAACPAGPCNGNTWAQVYDSLGRYIFAGVTLDF
ncbi:MAG: TonB-dependent receptor [Sphingomonas sp.]